MRDSLAGDGPYRQRRPFLAPQVPRKVPWGVELLVLLGGPMNQLGWFFLGFGMIFLWVMFPGRDVAALWQFTGARQHASGEVVRVTRTHSSEDERTIYEVEYRFEDDQGEKRSGVGYSTSPPGSGARVDVEYLARDPSVSRARGLRRSPFSLATLFVLVFPLVGLIFVVAGIRAGRRALVLLSQGRLTRGRLVSKEETGTRINKRMVYRFTFEFEDDDGKTQRATAKTHQTELLEDEEQERLLYHPLDPRFATLLDHLPGRPDLDESGAMVAPAAGRILGTALIPTATVIGHGAVLVSKLIG